MASAPQPMLKPMEKVMLGMTGFFALGIVIFGFLPPNGFRGMVMTAYVLLFVAFIYNPFGVKDKQAQIDLLDLEPW